MPEITPLPPDYATWPAQLRERIHQAQQRATLAVNRELVLLYWHIGRDILERQEREGWGTKVIERLAQDLRAACPDMQGFSPRNLKYMRSFAEAWPDGEFVQAVLAQLPWYHQIALLDKLNHSDERRWYAAKAIEHGWSIANMKNSNRWLEKSVGRTIHMHCTANKPIGMATYQIIQSLNGQLPWPEEITALLKGFES